MNDSIAATPGPADAITVKEPSMFDSPEWTGIQPDIKRNERREPIIGIRFQAVGKVYHYNATGFENIKVGQWVIVDTARGRQMGQVATLKEPRTHGGPYKRIERMASGRDMAMRHFYERKEIEAMIACRAENAAVGLPIKIVRAEYAFDGQTLTFLFSSDQEERIETGALRDRMSHLYRARIEFRQISPREVAKILGGMGACGIEERCCSKFLTEFSPVSIKHAKEQNLSLNPHDITGMCGRLRCCLVYEFEQYVAAKSTLPKLKSMIGTPSGEGKVVELLHLRDSVKVKIGEGIDARVLIFHREQLTPLEELRRLQEKAMNGTCDKHEGGGCDCGRKGPKSQPAQPQPKIADGTGEAPESGREAPLVDARMPDPQRDARIKERRDKIKARNEAKQQRREEIRKQLKAKARLSQTSGENATRPEAPSQERPASSTEGAPRRERPERPDRGAQSSRLERADRGARPNRPNRQERSGGNARPERGERSARPPQQPRADAAPGGQPQNAAAVNDRERNNRRRNRKPLMRRREGNAGAQGGAQGNDASSGDSAPADA